MKQIYLSSSQRKSPLFSFVICLFLTLYAIPSYSVNYFVNVGESITIDPPSAASTNGYIDQVYLLQTSNALKITQNADCSVKITVNSYFDNTITVGFRFVEKYTYNGHIGKVDHDIYVNITCKYVKPTSVSLPDVTIAVGSGADIIPTIVPSDATIKRSSWTRSGSCIGGSAREGHFYHVSGRTVGTGTVTVVLNDNDNLTASCKVTVVDPDNMPPTFVSLPESKTISVGGSVRLTPALLPENSSTTYKWSSDNESVATVDYGKVTGRKVGKAIITVKTANGLTASCQVIVSSTGPFDDESDDNFSGSVDGYDYVDLGLSVKWATYNVGASKSEDYGGYFAWGETSEKSVYKWDTYSYGTYMYETYIGDNIKGTNYDVAHEKWGSNWRMPTEKEFRELYSNCTVKSTTRNSVEGYEFIGNNGASIFLPSAGYKNSSGFNSGFRYWASNLSSTDPGFAASILITQNKYKEITTSIQTQVRMIGMPVRPVTESSGTSTKQQLWLSASPSGGEVEKGTVVTLSADVSGAEIYYTLDGSTPSKSSKYYSSPITINETCTLKAIAFKDGYYSSDVLTEYYTVSSEPASTPGGSIEINATNFPDANFRNYLQEQDYGKDGVITSDEISGIKTINISSKDIKTLKGVEYFTSLTLLWCDSNLLTSLDVSKNTALKSLLCGSNQLTSLDVSKNTALTELGCGFNQLSSLDVSNNTSLVYLYCYSNQLTTLDVSKNTGLKELWCNSNQLTSLDVSKNNALIKLICEQNNLNSLDVSKNKELEYIRCLHNCIKEAAMDNLINSLTNNTTGKEHKIYVFGFENSEENVCTKNQVAAIKAKGWTPYDVYGNEYTGSDPSGIKGIMLDEEKTNRIFDLSGKPLPKPRKGINIIDGKKVIVR